MKKIIFAIAAVVTFAACNNTPTADKAETTEKQTAAAADGTSFKTDSTSLVTWTGTKPGGAHTGTFAVTEGFISAKDGNITAGNFIIDINTLSDKDLTDATGKGKLEGHLKSADFFDAAKFPTAKFEITGVEPFKYDSATMKDVVMKDATHTIKGNFSLKDSIKNISFPAKVTVEGNKLTAVADFNIDRTQWGLNYKGPNNPQDWFISKTVNIKLNIAAANK
ncbi:YceI family protein [Ferruginibacter sp. SUN002]|uniref:YceI family protein n=1 Tax=Ferruginibacter sp. SUN002 TaxID=2937789 RepID=UPI003D35D56C